MAQINTDLETLKTARDNMKTALEGKGQTVNTDIRTYAEAISNISGGGGSFSGSRSIYVRKCIKYNNDLPNQEYTFKGIFNIPDNTMNLKYIACIFATDDSGVNYERFIITAPSTSTVTITVEAPEPYIWISNDDINDVKCYKYSDNTFADLTENYGYNTLGELVNITDLTTYNYTQQGTNGVWYHMNAPYTSSSNSYNYVYSNANIEYNTGAGLSHLSSDYPDVTKVANAYITLNGDGSTSTGTMSTTIIDHLILPGCELNEWGSTTPNRNMKIKIKTPDNLTISNKNWIFYQHLMNDPGMEEKTSKLIVFEGDITILANHGGYYNAFYIPAINNCDIYEANVWAGQSGTIYTTNSNLTTINNLKTFTKSNSTSWQADYIHFGAPSILTFATNCKVVDDSDSSVLLPEGPKANTTKAGTVYINIQNQAINGTLV